MNRNVEIKAAIPSVEELLPRASAIADRGPFEIIQDDTFFVCAGGRLKLRMFNPTEGELIFYRRPDQQGPKESCYLRSPTTAPETLRESLSLAYGQAGRVQKHRTLFLVGRTRVHLDRVVGLGDFLEIEVVLNESEPSETGVREAHEILAKLGIEDSQLIEGAYLDLLNRVSPGPSIEATVSGKQKAAAHVERKPPFALDHYSEECMKTHYLEVVTKDVESVCAAYAAAFDVQFGPPVPELGGARTAPLAGGGLVGIRAPLRESEDPVVRPYWLVEDIVSALAAAARAGGMIAMEPMEIPGYGKFAIYLQGGNDHGLWQL